MRIAEKLPSSTRLQGDAGYDKGKRAFFSQAAGNAKEAAAASADYVVRDALGAQPSAEEAENAAPLQYLKVMADGTLPHFIPDRRERLLDALAQMGDPEPAMISTRLWGHVSIDMSRCTSCRMCATFCPTGAIAKFDEADGTMGIEHRSGDCVKCRCCTDICPEGALAIDDEVSTTAITEGLVERHIMPTRTKVPSGPHAILDYMKDLISDTDQIYER